MRKWTTSACVVLAWCMLLVAVAAVPPPGRPAQANISIASTTQMTLASAPGKTTVRARVAPGPAEPAATWTVRPGDTLSAIAAALAVPGGWQALYAANRRVIGPDPGLIRPGTVLALPGTGAGTGKPARYTIAPGDTLSAIATALAVPGGWQALYAANRRVIGPDPGLIRPGAVLTAPRPAAPAAARQAVPRKKPRLTAPAPVRPGDQAPPPATAGSRRPPRPLYQAPAPAGRRPSRPSAALGAAATPAGGMPRWLLDILIAVVLLVATAFAAEPAAAVVRRRRAQPARPRAPGRKHGSGRRAARKVRIILAEHERLIVTYSVRDHTIYVLTPPGEEPRAVLCAARLILPEDTYEELADHLGVPSAWPLE
jgi:LysM repeat protein